MKGALDLLRVPALLTGVLGVLLVAVPGRSELVVHVYTLVVVTVVLVQLVSRVRQALPPRAASSFDAALRRRPPRAARLAELEKIEREVTLGAATAFDLHYRLRPPLRRTAGELLAARRGIDLDGEPDAARRALGEDAWELVRDDREPPHDRFGAGIDLATLDRVVTSLEAL